MEKTQELAVRLMREIALGSPALDDVDAALVILIIAHAKASKRSGRPFLAWLGATVDRVEPALLDAWARALGT